MTQGPTTTSSQIRRGVRARPGLAAGWRGALVGGTLLGASLVAYLTSGMPRDPLVWGTAFLFGLAPALSSYVELVQQRSRRRWQLIPWALLATLLGAFGLAAPLYQLGYLRGMISKGTPQEALGQGLEMLGVLGGLDAFTLFSAFACGLGLVTVTRITRFDWERYATWVFLGYPTLAFAAISLGSHSVHYSVLLGLMIAPLVAMVLTKAYDAADALLAPLLTRVGPSESKW